MITPVKNYLVAVLNGLGVQRIHTDVSNAKGHQQVFPWALVTTPRTGNAETLQRAEKHLTRVFRDEDYGGDNPTQEELDARDTYQDIHQTHTRVIQLQIELHHRTEAECDSLWNGFVAGVASEIIIDPDHSNGYRLAADEAMSPLNFRARLRLRATRWSDSLAHGRNETVITAGLEASGLVVKAVVVPAITRVVIDAEYEQEEAS